MQSRNHSHSTSATDQPNFLKFIDLVIPLWEWTLDGETVSRLQRMYVFGSIAIVVFLDHECQFAHFIRGRNGGVRTDDGIALGILQGFRVRSLDH